MSGVEVIGLVSGLITILETANKLRKALTDARGLDPTIRQATDRLPLALEILRAAQTSLEIHAADDGAARAAFKTVLESCEKKALSLRDILQTVTIEGNDPSSASRRYASALRGLGKARRVDELMKSIMSDVHLLVDGSLMRTSTTRHENPERPKPTIETSASGTGDFPPHNFSNWHGGLQFNSVGGTQNNNTSLGKQYIAQTMNFS